MWSWRKSKAKEPVFNINHPDLQDKVEEAFTCAGKKYYRFKDEYQMPTGRYKWQMSFLREVDLRMDLDTFKGYINEIKSYLNPQKGGSVNLENIWKTVFNLETRANLAFEDEGVRRLASVVFFDSSESLDGYNMKHNREKIALWKEHEFLDFFLTEPISGLLRIKNISIEFLKDCIQVNQEIIQDLNSAQQSRSLENLSENGTKI